MRAILILLVTSTATVITTWLSLKIGLGFVGAWVIATAIIFVSAFLIRGRSAY